MKSAQGLAHNVQQPSSTQPIKFSQYALDSANWAQRVLHLAKETLALIKIPDTLTQSCQQACQQQGERTCLEYHETSFPTYVKVLL